MIGTSAVAAAIGLVTHARWAAPSVAIYGVATVALLAVQPLFEPMDSAATWSIWRMARPSSSSAPASTSSNAARSSIIKKSAEMRRTQRGTADIPVSLAGYAALRRRAAAPITPRPESIRAKVVGSGTTATFSGSGTAAMVKRSISKVNCSSDQMEPTRGTRSRR